MTQGLKKILAKGNKINRKPDIAAIKTPCYCALNLPKGGQSPWEMSRGPPFSPLCARKPKGCQSLQAIPKVLLVSLKWKTTRAWGIPILSFTFTREIWERPDESLDLAIKQPIIMCHDKWCESSRLVTDLSFSCSRSTPMMIFPYAII